MSLPRKGTACLMWQGKTRIEERFVIVSDAKKKKGTVSKGTGKVGMRKK